MKPLTVDDIIKDWSEHEAIVHSYSIEHRLLELAQMARDDEEDYDMNTSSLLDALQFLNSRPSLTLDADGCINAVWDIFDHKFIVRFKGSGETQTLLTKID